MTFLHGALAIAGAAMIGIPILIHILFRQRRKPMKWGAMRFLLEAYQKARSRMRLEQWLLLALRCLIVGLLGLAAARPLMQAGPFQDFAGARRVYILIDNGLASGLLEGSGTPATALERHKGAAREIIDALSPADRVGLIALAEPVEGPVATASIDHAAVVRALEGIGVSDAPTNIAEGLARTAEGLRATESASGGAIVYLLSDFRLGSLATEQALTISLENGGQALVLLATSPAQEQAPNVQITSVTPLRAVSVAGGEAGADDVSGRVNVTLRRTGDVSKPGLTTLRLSAEPGTVSTATGTIAWTAGQTEARSSLTLDVGEATARGLILTARIDEDGLASDNTRRALIETRTEIRVGIIDRREFGSAGGADAYSGGAWLRRALNPSGEAGEASGGIAVEDIDPMGLDDGVLRGMDVLALVRPDLVSDAAWESLRRHLERGGMLWIMPPAQESVALWADKASEVLRLPWRWEREVRVIAGAEGGGMALAARQNESDLLRVIGAEIPELTRPVRVARVLPIAEGAERGSTALALEDGTGLLAVTGAEGAPGVVVYLASALNLEWTTLPAKPLMVALAQEVIRQGAGLARQSVEMRPGERPALSLPTGTTQIKGADGMIIALRPEGNLMRPARAVERAGVLAAMDGAGQTTALLTSNIDPQAGRTDVQSPAVVEQWLRAAGAWEWIKDDDNPASVLASTETADDVGWLLLLVAAGCALLETALARWFSHAKRSDLNPAETDHGLLTILAPRAEGAEVGGRRSGRDVAREPQEAAP